MKQQSLFLLDEPIITLELEDILVELGYRIAARAGSVDEALRHVAHDAINAAILDLRVRGKWSASARRRHEPGAPLRW